MKITIKNLQQQTFLVDVDPEKTVVELKEQIYNERGEEYPVEKQNLIYAGVILDDEKTIASYNIRSNKFLVVMIKRDLGLSPSQPDESGVTKKVDKQSTTTTANSSNSSSNKGDGIVGSDMSKCGGDLDASTSDNTVGAAGTNVGTTKTANKESKNMDKGKIGTESSATKKDNNDGCSGELNAANKENRSGGDGSGQLDSNEPRSSSTNTRSVESVLLMGEEYNRMVNSLMEMGYSKDMVESALQASYNNPERVHHLPKVLVVCIKL